ncbi:ABC transporter substrate-binding protein [Halococcus saccharolyticus]|uniref:Dipeptide ABC transporter dipeptide-binding protein n=1 Tax=Halococcus saccharolyticus DSM 5350 TaxID=1227455 RepID=M0MAG1_9EURY|nr:ABC transporter substrate-binding protein [Halococcus saccharolyticus]EMA42736.1 dipeptide ABC transporter dipeptide-binding protein [Halococcus saccharolyticus DSM 5350]
MDESDLSRRRFLQATGGAAAAAALAGCSGGGGGGDNGSGSGSGNGSGGGSGNESSPAETNESAGGNASEDANASGNQSSQDPMEGGPGETDRTVQDYSGTMTTFDPVAATDETSGYVVMNVFDALTNYPDATTTVENLLASEYETSNGDKTYTFTLKEGVTFSNGDTLTASDFVYSFERLAASSNSKRAGFILGDLGVKHETDSEDSYQPGSMAVSAEDERTLTIELTQANPAALQILAYAAFSAVPEGIVGDIEGSSGEMEYSEFASSNPIGAGPYTLETYNSGTEAEIAARDDYHGEGPMTAGTHWQIISKSPAQYAYTVTNQNSDFPAVPTAQYSQNKLSAEGTDDAGYEYGTYQLANGIDADVYHTEELSCFYYGFNCRSVPKYVRQAVAHVNNNQEVIDQLLKKPAKAAYHFVPPKIYPGGRSAYEEHAQQYPYGYQQTQIEEARQIMEENGHGPNNPYEFTMTSYPDAIVKRTLNLLRDKLRQAHINMSIKQTTFSTLVEQAYSGNTEGYTLGWIADWPQPTNFLKLLYPPSTDTSSSGNVSGLNWMDTDAANSAASAWEKIQNNPTESGQQARNQAVVSMLEAVWEDVPMITTRHSVAQHMEYPWLYKPRTGAMGPSRIKHNTFQVGERQS